MKLTVGFSYNRRIFSRIVRWFTRSNVSHTYIRQYSAKYDEMLVFQASGLRVNYENFEHFKTYQIVAAEYDITLSEAQYVATVGYMLKQLGKPYGIKAVLGYGLVIIARMFGITMQNPFNDGEATFVCSEAVARVLGIEDYENMTPESLHNWIKEHHGENKIQTP